MMYAINRTEDALLHHFALVIFEGGAPVPPTLSFVAIIVAKYPSSPFGAWWAGLP